MIQHVPGFATIGEVAQSVVTDLEATINTRPVAFWLVWTKGSNRNPRRSHMTLESAQAEARRLALKHPDRRWFVVQAVERVWVNEAEDHPEAA